MPLSWYQTDSDVTGKAYSEQLVYSAALSGNGDEIWAGCAGVLRIFGLSGNDWTLCHDLSSAVATDVTGVAVALEGSTFVAGDPFHNGYTGRAIVYRRSLDEGSRWEQHGKPLNGEKVVDKLGWKVDVNGNVTVVVLGAMNGVDVYSYNDEAKRGDPKLMTRI